MFLTNYLYLSTYTFKGKNFYVQLDPLGHGIISPFLVFGHHAWLHTQANFPTQNAPKNLGKTIKRHKPSKHVITIVHPKCILSKLMELRHIQMSIYTLWVCLNPIETDSSGFLRHLEPILMGFLNNSGKFRSHLFQNGCFCLF